MAQRPDEFSLASHRVWASMMAKYCSRAFRFAAIILVVGMHVPNPAFAQNMNDLLTIFGSDRRRAAQAAQTEWRRLPPAEMSCIDQGLRRKGSSVEALVRRGVKPSATRLIDLRSSCRQSAEGVQTGTAPALARDATDSSTPTVPASNPTKPNSVTLPPSGATLPSPAESDVRVAEEHVQQGNVEPKNSLQENRTGWLSQAFLIAIMVTAVLLGIVIQLFMRRRSIGQRTAEANLIPNKNSEGGEGKAPSETTIGNPSEVAMPIGLPLADELIQLPDEAGQRAAISMNQSSGYGSKIVSTNEEVLPNAVLIEPSELNTTNSSAVENVARLAKLYAMGTPSEKEFQRLKGLISQSLRNSQAPI
jgi:hypothetical protein